MVLGIGLGIMAVLCAVGLIAGGGLFMHQEWKQTKGQEDQVMQRSHGHRQSSESSPGNMPDEQKQKIMDPERSREAGEGENDFEAK